MSEELNMELTKLISKAAIDGTLSESAVKRFTEVLAANKTLTETLRETERRRIDSAKDADRFSKDNQKLRDELAGYREREKELSDKESQAEVLAMTVKYEQKRVDDHKEMVGLIFRNAVLKKGVMTPLLPGEPNQYNSCPSGGFAQKDEVEETTE